VKTRRIKSKKRAMSDPRLLSILLKPSLGGGMADGAKGMFMGRSKIVSKKCQPSVGQKCPGCGSVHDLGQNCLRCAR
jgi:hypothetical protein